MNKLRKAVFPVAGFGTQFLTRNKGDAQRIAANRR